MTEPEPLKEVARAAAAHRRHVLQRAHAPYALHVPIVRARAAAEQHQRFVARADLCKVLRCAYRVARQSLASARCVFSRMRKHPRAAQALPPEAGIAGAVAQRIVYAGQREYLRQLRGHSLARVYAHDVHVLTQLARTEALAHYD